MSLLGHAAYKDSGTDWLGRVPSHWEVHSLKHGYSIVGGSTPKSDEPTFWDGDINWVTPADLSKLSGLEIRSALRKITAAGLASCGTSMVPAGSVVLSTRAPIGSLGLAAEPLCTNQGCKSLVPVSGQASRYAAYVLSIAGRALNVRGKGTTFLELSGDELARFPFPFPRSDEQEAIAAFLDRETAKIDALIAEQEKLLVLLAEKRQATISHAVTRGLAPDVPTRPSGLTWLGDIPAHWELVPLKELTEASRPIMYGIVLPGPDVGEGGIPILKGGNVRPSRMKLDEMARTTAEIEAPYARARLRGGDLVYSIRGSIGDCEIVPSELAGSNITQDVARIAVRERHSAEWVRWALLSAPVREDLASGSLGAAIRGVNIFDLKRVRLPTPPREEQDAIARFLNDRAASFERLTTECSRAISLLREHRSALIAAAVTGQIDVRGLAPAKAAA